MGWGTYRHRPMGTGGPLGGSIKWRRARMLVSSNVVRIDGPMLSHKSVLPGTGPILVDSLGDVHQRVYLEQTSKSRDWQRSIRVSSSASVAPAVGGLPPGTGGAWVEIGAAVVTNFGFNMGHWEPYQQFLDPSEYQGDDYLDISTTVWQPPEYWESAFTVRHELWANAYLYQRALAVPEENQRARIAGSQYAKELSSRSRGG